MSSLTKYQDELKIIKSNIEKLMESRIDEDGEVPEVLIERLADLHALIDLLED